MSIQMTPWDTAELLKTPEELAQYIDVVLEEDQDSPAMLADTVAVAARARGGVARLSEESGIAGDLIEAAMTPHHQDAVNVLRSLQHAYEALAAARKVA